MGKIMISQASKADFTLVSNYFIDQYLPKARGEYVKLYLYLLRQVSAGNSVSSEEIADFFDYTENDIRRGLSFWKKQGVLSYDTDEKQTITSIQFLDLSTQATAITSEIPASVIPAKESFSADRLNLLLGQAEIKQLIFIAERYLGKTLSPTEINSILYYFLTLGFSEELVEYLIEYSVSHGNKSFHYMDKVAISWAESGVRNIRDAKENSSLYSKKYYQVLRCLGISGRSPASFEIECIDRWYDEYHFTFDLIEEACKRTIAQTQQPNFQYADKILASWYKEKVHHLDDVKKLDDLHQKKVFSSQKKTPPTQSGHNRFNNFQQRDYDFDKLESQLLNQQN